MAAAGDFSDPWLIEGVAAMILRRPTATPEGHHQSAPQARMMPHPCVCGPDGSFIDLGHDNARAGRWHCRAGHPITSETAGEDRCELGDPESVCTDTLTLSKSVKASKAALRRPAIVGPLRFARERHPGIHAITMLR